MVVYSEHIYDAYSWCFSSDVSIFVFATSPAVFADKYTCITFFLL